MSQKQQESGALLLEKEQKALKGWGCPAVEIDPECHSDAKEQPMSAEPEIDPIPQGGLPPASAASAEISQAAPVEGLPAEKALAPAQNQLAEKLANLLKHFTKARKPKEELEEDAQKFGGLEEDAPPDSPMQAEEGPMPRASVPQSQEELCTASQTLPEIRETAGALSPILQPLAETYGWAYTECYYIGIQVLRNLSDMRRWCFGLWMWMRYNIPYFVRAQRYRVARLFDRISDACLYPFRDITEKTKAMRRKLRKIAQQEGPGKGKASLSTSFHYLCSLSKPINSLASFLLPIMGCAVLAAVILYFQQLNYALEVDYSGVTLGYVATEGDFYEAKNRVYDRLINEEYAPLDDSRPIFRLVITDKENLLTPEALTNRIMTISKNEVVMADGVYIDGAFLGAVEDGNEFLFYIDSILDSYRTGTAHERVQFVKKVSLQRGIYPVSSVRPIHEIQNAVESNESLPQTHQVAKGETLESIAEQNNTAVEDIVQLNKVLQLRAEGNDDISYVREGDNILVNRVELSLGIQVIRRENHNEDIDYEIDYQDDKKQLEGYRVTLSNGVKGELEVVSDVTYIDGEKVDETVIERNVLTEPINARVVRGTLRPAEFLPAGNGNTSASFIWPVAGGYMSAGLYGYPGHTGMDIAAPQGTGIYAARAGTITYASNRNIWPYGKRVNINHGDGVTTLYAHCSEVMVQSGQYVVQGQLIAKIGRTGNASGNHCHFEVRINGQIVDPAKFIGNYYRG